MTQSLSSRCRSGTHDISLIVRILYLVYSASVQVRLMSGLQGGPKESLIMRHLGKDETGMDARGCGGAEKGGRGRGRLADAEADALPRLDLCQTAVTSAQICILHHMLPHVVKCMLCCQQGPLPGSVPLKIFSLGCCTG